MPAEDAGPGFRARAQQRQSDQDRTLLAMQQLEAALASAAPRREHAWRTEVRLIEDHYEKVGERLPDELRDELRELEKRLAN